MEDQASPPCDQNGQQALATFHHAAEQRRFFTDQQWRITNYALIAYAALAAAPKWVGPDSWQSGVSWGAFVLVLGVAVQALRVLADMQANFNHEGDRLDAALQRLGLMCKIDGELRKKKRKKWWRPWSMKRDQGQGTGRGSGVFRGLAAVVVLGWIVASVIIVSRIPYFQRVVACISQSASGVS